METGSSSGKCYLLQNTQLLQSGTHSTAKEWVHQQSGMGGGEVHGALLTTDGLFGIDIFRER